MSHSTGSTRLDTAIHLLAGGMGGTAGAIVTCPLEVVKTRLQSSNSGFGSHPGPPRVPPVGGTSTGEHASASASTGGRGDASKRRLFNDWRQLERKVAGRPAAGQPLTGSGPLILRYYSSSYTYHHRPQPNKPTMNVIQCLRYIVETEGPRGLFKGLGPNLVGVAPSRAIYFFTYSTAKRNVNATVPSKNRDTPFVHVVSAATAGFCASTCTNPIWLVKTRLQLDRATGSRELTVRQCVGNIFRKNGVTGFWKGVTASYWGISETIIHFVIYESLKKKVVEQQQERRRRRQRKSASSSSREQQGSASSSPEDRDVWDFAGFMLCGACSKTCATIVAYPHEVARTRLREEGTKYKSFWPTLVTVAREEGRRGLYRGLVTQLIRQIPNTAIMMATYELTVYLMTRYVKGHDGNSNSQ